MKTSILATTAIAAILISCTKSIETGLTAAEFNAVFETLPDTRTSLKDNFSVIWNEGDGVSAIDKNGNIYELAQSGLSADGKSARFSGEVPSEGCSCAIYPEQTNVSMDNGSLILSIPSTQEATARSFDPETQLSIARMDGSSTICFKNVGSLIGIKAEGNDIKSIKLYAKEKDGGALTGSALVDISGSYPTSSSDLDSGNDYVEISGEIESGIPYYASVYPGSYSELRIIFTDTQGRTATFESANTLDISRSSAITITPFTINDSDWKSAPTPITATLTYDEINDRSSYIKGYNNPTVYTNSYGSWDICAYNYSSAFQLNEGKVSYLGTPDFPGEITRIKITTALSYTGDYYICNQCGSTSAAGKLATAKCSGTVTTIDVTDLKQTKLFIRSSACVRISALEVVYGGTVQEGEDPEQPADPKPNPDPNAKADFGWFELPAQSDKDGNGIDDNISDYYYSHTFREDAPGIRNFSCCYSKSKMQPIWVAAPMHSCYKGSSGRNDSYKADPNISCAQTSKVDGYTRGHMLGSSDRTISKPTNRQVFYYSNIGAQIQSGFNTGGGAWNNLESLVDGQWCSDTLYQVIGCIFDSFTDRYGVTTEPKSVGSVQIPTAYYKVLLRTKNGNTGKSVDNCSASELKCAAFILSHRSNSGHKPTSSDLYTVEQLEEITGLNYFVNVPNAPKGTANASDWGL